MHHHWPGFSQNMVGKIYPFVILRHTYKTAVWFDLGLIRPNLLGDCDTASFITSLCGSYLLIFSNITDTFPSLGPSVFACCCLFLSSKVGQRLIDSVWERIQRAFLLPGKEMRSRWNCSCSQQEYGFINKWKKQTKKTYYYIVTSTIMTYNYLASTCFKLVLSLHCPNNSGSIRSLRSTLLFTVVADCKWGSGGVWVALQTGVRDRVTPWTVQGSITGHTHNICITLKFRLHVERPELESNFHCAHSWLYLEWEYICAIRLYRQK